VSTNPQNVDRFEPLTGRDAVALIVEHPLGSYVRFSDWEKVTGENERLRTALEDMIQGEADTLRARVAELEAHLRRALEIMDRFSEELSTREGDDIEKAGAAIDAAAQAKEDA
jgi:ABC-type transporter Mla subunit MlaD